VLSIEHLSDHSVDMANKRPGAGACAGVLIALSALGATAQPPARPPVIDVHVHNTNTTPERTLERMGTLNIRYVVLSTTGPDYGRWAGALTSRQFLPGIVMPCYHGHAPYDGRACFTTETEFPEITWLRTELQAGHIKAFAEIETEYVGMIPSDPRMEPFWQLAEDFDVPVGIHMGPGPPGVAYAASPLYPPVKSLGFRVAAGDPLLLEEVLLKHQHLRLWVMHAGWPKLESMVALLYAHPQVYVDVAALQSERVIPRSEYYRYLRALVDIGFAKRIMFGSDFPDEAGAGIDAITGAEFLTAEQKADILCWNAARFLRLDDAVCAP
jgi:hypothetical protein